MFSKSKSKPVVTSRQSANFSSLEEVVVVPNPPVGVSQDMPKELKDLSVNTESAADADADAVAGTSQLEGLEEGRLIISPVSGRSNLNSPLPNSSIRRLGVRVSSDLFSREGSESCAPQVTNMTSAFSRKRG